MAPARPAARWAGGGLGTRGEGVAAVGCANKSVRRRTWWPSHAQAFAGSLRQGQGFAFRRKLKTQQNYKKLQWKQKAAQGAPDSQFTDRYPEHLKHLYLAEEERLKKRPRKVERTVSEGPTAQPPREEQEGTDQALPGHQPKTEQSSKTVSSITNSKKNKKKTSNQKAQEEYEQIQAERAAKKQEFERRKQEREAAQRLYKKKKMETFKILSKKTKKGQPNLNLQMEYLLQKIQEKN
ncbi:thyroid transcription factor 1-associated protein 26 [Ochotona princeps]|uniref:thyroid transcription factor 1-associated protein 26 n=1 Tax=Ochotona princeps TaxID=9978 RepID=UPI0027153258|nr:thyroid transcription factor 1-associated protein 26 [Ochotona princeps]